MVWLAMALAALEATATPAVPVEPISPARAANASAVGPPVEAVSPPSRPSRSITGRVRGEMSVYTDTDHVSVFTPSLTVEAADATKGWSARANYLVDAVSGASVDIVSTASPHWTEARQAGGAEASYKPGDLGFTGAGSFSSEPDYLAWAAGGTAMLDLDQKNFTLLAGYAYGHDTIGRSGTPFSVFSRSVSRNAFNSAVTIVVNPTTLLVVGGDLVRERGDSSKPYRYIPLFTPEVAAGVARGASVDDVNRLRLPERPLEQLPLARDRYAAWARYLHRFSRETLRLEERLYTDTWSLRATSTDARLMVDWRERWQLSSHLRFHAQSPVSFWQRAYTLTEAGVPALRTGDRELGPLWNLTAGGGFRWKGGRPHPTGWTIGGDIDVTYTSFLDDLFVSGRLAGIATFVWEADLL